MLFLLDLYWGYTYMATFHHSMMCIILGCATFMTGSELIAQVSTVNSLLYFVADMIYFREKGQINWGKLVHHLSAICLCLCALTFARKHVSFMTNAVLLHEMSNPAWTLLRIFIDKQDISQVFLYEWAQNERIHIRSTGLTMIIVFGICRFLLWPIYYYKYYPICPRNEMYPTFCEYDVIRFFLIHPLNLLSVYWFYLMIRGSWKHYQISQIKNELKKSRQREKYIRKVMCNLQESELKEGLIRILGQVQLNIQYREKLLAEFSS